MDDWCRCNVLSSGLAVTISPDQLDLRPAGIQAEYTSRTDARQYITPDEHLKHTQYKCMTK
jgi:hypothetical protein